MYWKLERVVLFFLLLTSIAGVALAQNNPCQTSQPVSTLGSVFVSQATIVYDPNQGVCWLANANLAANPDVRASLVVSGIDPNGSMDFAAAQSWVAALNAYNNGLGYLGHNNWQLPVAPLVDHTCADTGTFGGSFGPQCTGSALGNLYAVGLKQTFPSSVAPGLAATVGPIHNLKASYYWALQNNGGTSGTSNGGQETFSFANGIQGGNTINDTYFYVLPMVAGAIGTQPSCPAGGAAVVPYTSGAASGNAIYDCRTGFTWAADANLAASNSFGITGNVDITNHSGTITAPKISSGAMLFQTATEWIQAMNSSQYLGSSAWQIPATSAVLRDLFRDLNIASGDTRLLWTGTLGPFQNLQPFFYWACQRDQTGNSQSPCTGYAPPDGSSQLQWSFNFDYGFQPTSSIVQKFFVTVYYPAAASSVGPPTPLPGPLIGNGGIVNNASYASGAAITPGSIAAIFGTNLTGGTACLHDAGCDQSFAANGRLNTSLAGTQVTVNGIPVPILYAAPAQLGIQIPFEIAGTSARVAVTSGNGNVSAVVNLAPVSPGIFNANGVGAVTHADAAGTAVSTQNPARRGEVVILYGTGLGQVSPAVPTGAVPTAASNAVTPVTLTVGGINVIPDFSGLAGCCVGLNQINFQVPATVSPGNAVPVFVSAGGKSSNGVTMAVQ